MTLSQGIRDMTVNYLREADGTICPASENPMPFFLRWGWQMLYNRLYPGDRIFNPIFYYLIGRRKSAGLAGDLGSFLFWLALIAIEAGAVIYCDIRFSIVPWYFLFLLQFLFMPAILGLWVQSQIQLHYLVQCRRIPMEELKTTRLTPSEIMFGFLIRPLSRQMFGLAVYKICSFALLGWAVWLHLNNSLKFMSCDLFLVALLLAFRTYVYSVTIHLSAALGIRATLFAHGRLAPLARAWRDWLWPYAMLPWAVIMVCAIVFFTSFVSSALTFVLCVILVPLTLWLIATIPATLIDQAADILYWVPRQLNNWRFFRDDVSELVPKHLWMHWPAHAQRRSKVKSSKRR